jgi:hypothetical protein
MFSWDEVTSLYDSMRQNCQFAADQHTRDYADNAVGMLKLIGSLRAVPNFDAVNLWISHDALVINAPNSGKEIRVWYEPDASYVVQSYSQTLDETAEVRAEAEQVVARIEQYMKWRS